MTEPKQYTIRTLQDVYEQVPSERIMDCLHELGQLILLYRAVSAVVDYVVEENGVQPEPHPFPEAIVWIDDNERTLTVHLKADGTESMAFQITNTQAP